jgi:hypothetical protein
MGMNGTEPGADRLDDLLDGLRQPDSALPDALLARILADAAATSAARNVVAFPRRGGLAARVLEPFGGWRAAAAIAACMVAGFVLGLSGQGGMLDPPLAEDLTADDAVVSFEVVDSDDLLVLFDRMPEI